MYLKQFFSYYGGKHRLAPLYPTPTHRTVIEPFAGSAGYACRHAERQVRLYDTNPIIVGVWDYLIRVSPEEVRQLPLDVTNADDLPIPQEARWLIGFWLQGGKAKPSKKPGSWMLGGTNAGSFWGTAIRERIASQVDAIRHWRITQSSVFDIPNYQATWFVDPPYQNKCGLAYPHQFKEFDRLGEWCQSRRGQVIVCEQAGATWLPFQPFRTIASTPGHGGGRQLRSAEVIYTT